jgi:hypothetical protein
MKFDIGDRFTFSTGTIDVVIISRDQQRNMYELQVIRNDNPNSIFGGPTYIFQTKERDLDSHFIKQNSIAYGKMFKVKKQKRLKLKDLL